MELVDSQYFIIPNSLSHININILKISTHSVTAALEGGGKAAGAF